MFLLASLYKLQSLSKVLLDNQLDAQIFYITFIYLNPLHVHPQEDNCMNTTSVIITLC